MREERVSKAVRDKEGERGFVRERRGERVSKLVRDKGGEGLSEREGDRGILSDTKGRERVSKLVREIEGREGSRETKGESRILSERQK